MHDGGAGSICTRSCEISDECYLENAYYFGQCIFVNADGEPDPENGTGICMPICEPGAIHCGDESIYECIPLERQDALHVCAPW